MILSVLSKETQQGKSVTVAHLATIASRHGRACAIDWDERHGTRSLSAIHDNYKPYTDYDLRNGDSDLSELKDLYQHIVIDTEGNLPKQKTAALSRCEAVIIPTGTTASELDAAMATVHELRTANPDVKYYVLFTKVSDSKDFDKVYHEFARRHKVSTLSSYIPDNSSLATLAEQGLTSFDDRSNPEMRAISNAYNEVWQAINEGA